MDICRLCTSIHADLRAYVSQTDMRTCELFVGSALIALSPELLVGGAHPETAVRNLFSLGAYCNRMNMA